MICCMEMSKKHLDWQLQAPSKSVASTGVKNIFLSVSSSKQRNTNTLIPPSDIVFTAVCWGGGKTFSKMIFLSLRVGVFPSSCCHVFQAYGDKITSPELPSSWRYVAERQLKSGWRADSSHVRKLQIDDVNKVKETCKQSWHAWEDNREKTI